MSRYNYDIEGIMELKKILPILMGLRYILKHPFRSILISIGIGVSVGTLVCSLSLIEGSRQRIIRDFTKRGEDVIAILSEKGTLNVKDSLTIEDGEKIKNKFPHRIKAISIHRMFQGNAYYQDKEIEKAILSGVDSFNFWLTLFEVKYGRWFNETEIKNAEKVCVITAPEEQIEKIFSTVNPIGKTVQIKINEKIIPLKIVGIIYNNNPEIKYVNFPITLSDPNDDRLDVVLIQADIRNIREFVDELDRYLISLGKNFNIIKRSDIIYYLQKNLLYISSLFIAGTLICIITGAITIISLMIVSTKERLKEIAVRKVEGATNWDIVAQFIFENMVVCFLGGLLGTISGLLMAKFLIFVIPSPVLALGYPFGMFLLGCLISIFVGVTFGVIPAYQAVKVDPAVILRYE